MLPTELFMKAFIMTDHIAELLPWYLNGRLSADDRAKVTHHLQHCAQCTAELNLHKHLQAAITSPAKVEIAPQPSFNKLWERITAAENAEEALLINKGPVKTMNVSFQRIGEWLRLQWMPIALSIQAVALIALASALIWQHQQTGNDAAYRTVTSSANVDGAVFHVVFDDAIRLADVKDILLRSNLQVSSGPTAAGVYSLTPINRELNPQQVVKSLRDDPRVRFAEISHE